MRYSQADQTPHSHYHLSCEMVFVSAGAAEFVIDGKSYVAEENSLVFISSYEQHEVRVRRRPYRRYFAMVQAAEVERAFPSSPLPGIFQNRPQGFSHCVSLGGAAPEPERLFARLLAEWDSPAPYGEPMVRALLEEVLIHVYRACPQNFAPLETGAAGRVREVQRYIESHFAEDLRISDLAKAFYMNHCYMTHLFKKQVGYKPQAVFAAQPPLLRPGAAGELRLARLSNSLPVRLWGRQQLYPGVPGKLWPVPQPVPPAGGEPPIRKSPVHCEQVQ